MREEQLQVQMRHQARMLRCSVRRLLRTALRRIRVGASYAPLVMRASDYHSLAQHFEEAADRLIVLSQDRGLEPLQP